MTFSVKMVLASEFDGSKLYTLLIRYWRSIHSEFMTHRALSKNAGSSRAIPVKRMLEMVTNDPAGPAHWGLNQRGMQAEQENNELVVIPEHLQQAYDLWQEQQGFVPEYKVQPDELGLRVIRENAWKFSAWLMAQMSGAFSDAGYHKQIANRLTEPFQYIQVVVSGTDWQNFFDLRCHPDAMPEFQDLAKGIRGAIAGARPQKLRAGEWHLPFLLSGEDLMPEDVQRHMSAARCAHTSYRTVDDQMMTMDKALEVFTKLTTKPFHASPTEHQARAGHTDKRMSRNFEPKWFQHRALIESGELG